MSTSGIEELNTRRAYNAIFVALYCSPQAERTFFSACFRSLYSNRYGKDKVLDGGGREDYRLFS
jgi:hypothetical protein